MSKLITTDNPAEEKKMTMSVVPEHAELVNAIRAEICDEYISEGKPTPQANWLYRELVREKFRNRYGKDVEQK